MADITSANSIVAITAPGLFDTPVVLSGYSADAAWEADNLTIAEVQRGVDGRQTAGVVLNSVKQTFHFQADSPSVAIFDAIAQAQVVAKSIYYLTATETLPGPGKVYSGVRGVLTDAAPIPNGAKVLQPVAYTIMWESLLGSII